MSTYGLLETSSTCAERSSTVRAEEAEIERRGVRPEQLGQHLLRRLELRVPVRLGLDDLRVDAERDVVHEDPIVHEGEVDHALHRRGERLERSDDVVAVEPEVQGEVVSRPGGHTHERDVVLHRDLGDEGLRAVAAGHPDHVGRAGGLPCQRQQIVTRPEQHRFDTSPLRLQDELEPLHLPAAGSGIHQEDRLLGPRGRSSRRQLLPPRPADGVAGRHGKHDTRHQEDDKLVDRAADDHRHRAADQRGDRKTGGDKSDRPTTRQRDPTERSCDRHRREHEQQRHDVPHHQRNERRDHTGGRQQRKPRGEARHQAIAICHGQSAFLLSIGTIVEPTRPVIFSPRAAEHHPERTIRAMPLGVGTVEHDHGCAREVTIVAALRGHLAAHMLRRGDSGGAQLDSDHARRAEGLEPRPTVVAALRLPLNGAVRGLCCACARAGRAAQESTLTACVIGAGEQGILDTRNPRPAIRHRRQRHRVRLLQPVGRLG